MNTKVMYFCDLNIGEFFSEDALPGKVFQKITQRLAKCVKSENIERLGDQAMEKDFFGYGPDCRINQLCQDPKSFGTFNNEEDNKRDFLMSRIEGITGTLHSVPWDKISIEDMEKIYKSLKG